MEHVVCEKLYFSPSQEIAPLESALSLLFLELLVGKESSDSLFPGLPGERRLISLTLDPLTLSFRPTCFARRLVTRNLHETSTQRAR